LTGCAGVANAGVTRKQDKILLGELAGNTSTRNHLPESFTTFPAPEDRRPVQSQGPKGLRQRLFTTPTLGKT
jgi:hypothetical protein